MTLDARSRIALAVRESAYVTPLDELTASDVARLAGVHRVTFYRHWPDVSQALMDVFGDELERVSGVGPQQLEGVATAADLERVYDQALRGALSEVREHRSVYRVLFEWPPFRSQVLDRMVAHAETLIEALGGLGAVDPGVAGVDRLATAAFIGGAAMASLAWWAYSDSDDEAHQAELMVGLYPPGGSGRFARHLKPPLQGSYPPGSPPWLDRRRSSRPRSDRHIGPRSKADSPHKAAPETDQTTYFRQRKR